jgi:hypothetical protein
MKHLCTRKWLVPTCYHLRFMGGEPAHKPRQQQINGI